MKKTIAISALFAALSFACSGEESNAADDATDAAEQAADDAGNAIDKAAEEGKEALDDAADKANEALGN